MLWSTQRRASRDSSSGGSETSSGGSNGGGCESPEEAFTRLCHSSFSSQASSSLDDSESDVVVSPEDASDCFSGPSTVWSPALEWEARIPPIASDADAQASVASFRRLSAQYLDALTRLAEQNQELIELEDLLTRVEEGSGEALRITAALRSRYYENADFLAQARHYEQLRAQLTTLRSRVSGNSSSQINPVSQLGIPSLSGRIS